MNQKQQGMNTPNLPNLKLNLTFLKLNYERLGLSKEQMYLSSETATGTQSFCFPNEVA